MAKDFLLEKAIFATKRDAKRMPPLRLRLYKRDAGHVAIVRPRNIENNIVCFVIGTSVEEIQV